MTLRPSEELFSALTERARHVGLTSGVKRKISVHSWSNKWNVVATIQGVKQTLEVVVYNDISVFIYIDGVHLGLRYGSTPRFDLVCQDVLEIINRVLVLDDLAGV